MSIPLEAMSVATRTDIFSFELIEGSETGILRLVAVDGGG